MTSSSPQPAPQPTPEPAELLRRLEKAREERPWRYYTPVPKIRDGFHRSKAPLRLLTGPNGGGKTVAGADELVCYLTGYNHLRDESYPYPNRCWAVVRDMMNQGPIMQRTLERLLPKGTRWNDKKLKFTLPEPWRSECYLKTTESGIGAFTAERILAAYLDEERGTEEGLQIFKEILRRTQPGWPLRVFMTVTPIFGYTWTYDYLWKEDSPKRFPGTESFNFSLFDASIDNGGFLAREEIQDAIDKCRDSNDYRIRILGQYALVSGSPAFDSEALLKAMGHAQQGKRYALRSGPVANGLTAPILKEDPNGELVMLMKPETGRQYVLGADPSMGIRRDRGVASVWDRELPVECAYFASDSMPPAQFARQVIAPLGTYYNNALAAVESNSEAGGAVLSVLPTCYGHIYMRQSFDQTKRTFTHRYGYHTTGHSRGLLLGTFKDVLPMTEFVASEDLVREAMGMVADKDGRIDHVAGKNDDHVFAAMIALTVARTNPTPRYEPWSHYREDYKGAGASVDTGW